MTSLSTPTRRVPEDFPRFRPPAAVAGAQAKLAVRKVGDTYSADFTPEELTARHEMCEDLLLQLLPYCRRKQAERPDWTSEQLLDKVARSLRGKGWDLTDPELTWMVGQLGEQLGTRPNGRP